MFQNNKWYSLNKKEEIDFWLSEVEVFTEDPKPEDPGPVRVGVYILKGQPGPGRVPIYYFGFRVFLTLCVIPKSIGEHRTHQRSVSVSMRVFCTIRMRKVWAGNKVEEKKKHALPQPPETERGRS